MAGELKTAKPLMTTKKKAEKAQLNKKQLILTKLHTKDGADVPELMKLTNWKNHSIRAALSMMRKEGLPVIANKQSGRPTRYRLGNETEQ